MPHIAKAALLSVLAGLIALTSGPIFAQPEISPALEKFLVEGLPFFGSRVRFEEVRSFRPVIKEEKVKEKNPYDDRYTDLNFGLWFRGLRVWGVCPESFEGLCMLSVVDVSRPGLPVLFGLDLGAHADDVVAILGKPNRRTRSMLTYFGESDAVVFYLTNGRVTAIQWRLYTG